jgi:Pyruvate/2-oxoacid:ferredoxin oxidoreductase gamma subunit
VVKPSGKEVELAFTRIDSVACTGCGLCVQPCAPEAIVHFRAGHAGHSGRQACLRSTPCPNITNILVCGIGGQGVMTATEILSEAAIAEGHDVKKTEVAGMSQRGGVVTSHLRFGPKVLSPQIAPGTADVLLGFEAAEALRWSHYLKPGAMALVNDARLVPPVVELGLFKYPDDPIGEMRVARRAHGVLRRRHDRPRPRRPAPRQHRHARRHRRPAAVLGRGAARLHRQALRAQGRAGGGDANRKAFAAGREAAQAAVPA